MRPQLIVAVLLGLVGAVWIGQGLGYIPGSFMSGDPFWAAMGGVLAATAVAVVTVDRLRRRTPRG